MKGNYSPFNRTYKFICLQNQLAHVKNRNAVKSTGKSNISIHNSPDKRVGNDGLQQSSYFSNRPHHSSLSHFDDSIMNNRKYSFSIIDPYRVVHKNQSYDRKKKLEQYHENERLAKKLCQVSCNVITKDQTEKEFGEHVGHVNIARRYG